ncbi:MAG TPA: hypothetical protein VGI40_24210 [Pirellulaceae bacterium]|jgi:hypothetical protein
MALTLGFIVVFFAGVGIAYFVGLHAARSNTANPPNRSPAKNTSDIESNPDSESTPVSAAADSNQDPSGTGDLDVAAGQPSGDEKESSDGEFSDTRRFQRSDFSGTALATIYPPKRQVGGEPVRCEVLTRDLCCGGVGIAHTQRLLPQQTIVLDAVGKLLVGEVRWCRRIDKDLYFVGCRLIKTTT